MKTLIIYDNFACAAKASATLQHAANRANASADCEIKPWRLDVLRLPAVAEEALIEATDADLIVFAGPRAYSLPTWLQEWLECWVRCREVEEVALAVIREGTGPGLAAPAAPELYRFGARHGLNIIIENETTPKRRTLSAFYHARRLLVPPTLELAIPMPIRSSHRHWGINN